MKITELKGNAHVFTLKDGKTFRIFAREVKDVKEEDVSKEMRIAEKMGLIAITPVVIKKEVKEEDPQNKKIGGAK